MSSGQRPIGAAKGKQSDTEALCQIPPPPRTRAHFPVPPEPLGTSCTRRFPGGSWATLSRCHTPCPPHLCSRHGQSRGPCFCDRPAALPVGAAGVDQPPAGGGRVQPRAAAPHVEAVAPGVQARPEGGRGRWSGGSGVSLGPGRRGWGGPGDGVGVHDDIGPPDASHTAGSPPPQKEVARPVRRPGIAECHGNAPWRPVPRPPFPCAHNPHKCTQGCGRSRIRGPPQRLGRPPTAGGQQPTAVGGPATIPEGRSTSRMRSVGTSMAADERFRRGTGPKVGELLTRRQA